MKVILSIIALLLQGCCIFNGDIQKQRVTLGCHVCINYRLFNGDGVRFDGNNQPGGRVPFCFNVGNAEVIKSMDDALLDMRVGELKTSKILPEDGYAESGLYYVDHFADTIVLVKPNDTLTIELEILTIN